MKMHQWSGKNRKVGYYGLGVNNEEWRLHKKENNEVTEEKETKEIENEMKW